MKEVLIFVLVVLAIAAGGIELASRSVYQEPMALREDTPGEFSTPEEALESYIWARNNRDYYTYLEALGKTARIQITREMEHEASLWGRVPEYEIYEENQFGPIVRYRLFQVFIAPNGNRFPDQRIDMYLMEKEGRWVVLPEGVERTVWLIRSRTYGR